MTTDQDFPGKETHCRRVFYISIAKWSVMEDDTVMSKVAKSKQKPRGKNGKTAKCAEEQTTNRHTAFKIAIRGKC